MYSTFIMPITGIHKHTHHPFVALCAVVGAVTFGLLTTFTSVEAVSTKSYTHATDKYTFAYPSNWSVKKSSKTVNLIPPAKDMATWKKKGVTYSANIGLLNSDTAIFTSSLQTALSQSWTKFVSTYAKATAKKNGATSKIATYKLNGWNASQVALTKNTKGTKTTWRIMVLSKDKSKVYALTERWTKNGTSPFSSLAGVATKSLKPPSSASTEVSWTFNGSSWQASTTPPACADPLIIPSPVDVNLPTHILYPGQERGGNYKPHGGFRFDGVASDQVTVRAPFDGYVVTGSRYIEAGEVQYLFDIYSNCGIRVRFDHLYTLSSTFATLANSLPEPQVDNTQTTRFSSPVLIKAGDIVATAVGQPIIDNTSFDFGVYDLRQPNEISSDATWAEEHVNDKEMGWYGLCWLDYLSEEESATAYELPPGDQTNGATSDYCQ